MLRVLCVLMCCFLIGVQPVRAAEAVPPPPPMSMSPAEQPRPLLVGVTEAPPFAYKDSSGTWTGIAVELWRSIMERQERRFSLREMDLHTLLASLGEGRIDAAVTALSITSSRERLMDFSYPYFDTNLAVAVRHKASYSVFLNVIEEIFSMDFLLYVSVMLVFAMVSGLVIWLLERRVNPEEFHRGLLGVLDGIWWACVTMTTVGYGDTAPRSIPARLLAMFWMFTCVLLVAVFTASITTTLTVNRIGGKVTGVEDLVTVNTGCLSDSLAEDFLKHLRGHPRVYHDLDKALDDLRAGRLDAVLHDRPLLQHAIVQGRGKNLVILPFVVEKDDYGFAFPAHSPLRKQVNVDLLGLRADRTYWENLTRSFLGQ